MTPPINIKIICLCPPPQWRGLILCFNLFNWQITWPGESSRGLFGLQFWVSARTLPRSKACGGTRSSYRTSGCPSARATLRASCAPSTWSRSGKRCVSWRPSSRGTTTATRSFGCSSPKRDIPADADHFDPDNKCNLQTGHIISIFLIGETQSD